MGKWVVRIIVLFVIAMTVSMVMQHNHYLDIRRERVEDRQVLFHGSDVFHVVRFIKHHETSDGFDALKQLKELEEAADGRWIYAGKVAHNMLLSEQLNRAEWDHIILTEYPNRTAYDEALGRADMQASMDTFSEVYTHGMDRSALANLLLPQFLLFNRFGRNLTFAPSVYPFEQNSEFTASPRAQDLLASIGAADPSGEKAIVIVNLQLYGDDEIQAANSEYVGHMMGMMADEGFGPMHMGDAIQLQGDAKFDDVAIVYYPSTQFFKEMVTSTFMQSILGDKQLGDVQATVTIPILNELEG